MPREPAAPSSPVGSDPREGAPSTRSFGSDASSTAAARARRPSPADDVAREAGLAALARLRPDHGQQPRCLRHDRGGVLTPVSAFDLSARAMTKTRLTRLGSARPYVRWINLRAYPEDQASLSRAGMTDRKLNPLDGGFTVSPPVAASAPGRPSLPSPLASPSNRCSQGAVCRALSRLRPSNFVGLNAAGKRNESLASDRRQKLILSAVIGARRAQVLGRNCIPPNCTVGCQRLNVGCKQCSLAKSRLTPMG